LNWTCPYCNQPTTLTSPNQDTGSDQIQIAAEHLEYKHRVGLRYHAIACPNTDCKKLYLMIELRKLNRVGSGNYYSEGGVIKAWPLLPESSAKPQPSYIPEQIVTDYNEACRIKTLSPKASATLARRCLQGMIRDFWGIKKSNLKDAIDALEDKVTPEVWGAIDAVRSVGNIGAHMEKDINLIVEIDPDEAELLIDLIEDLFVDWYVVRHDRLERQARVKKLAEEKQKLREKPANEAK
jgi:hypothetical protein